MVENEVQICWLTAVGALKVRHQLAKIRAKEEEMNVQ